MTKRSTPTADNAQALTDNTHALNRNFAAASTLSSAHGPIPYGMMNDYMFRAVLQTNRNVLRGLICSLLHLKEEEVSSVTIKNPIQLSESVENKEFRLDIIVALNSMLLINLEMQVANQLNWQNRSLTYLCRLFDQLDHGQDYLDIKPVIHIGFLNYTLFQDCPEFYATHKLMNIKNHHIYSDNFILSVVDLSQIKLATDEDRKYHIDLWAALFKATTWEEIKMLASKNEYIKEASDTIFTLSADDLVRKRCRDREDYYQDLRTYERAIANKDNIIADKEKIIANKEKVIADSKKVIADKDNIIADSKKVIADKDNTIAALQAEIAALKRGNL